MMKNILLFSLLVVVTMSCNNKSKTDQEQTAQESTTETALPVFELDSLLNIADQEIDKTVKVVGYVTHTCKHSGKRCFIVGESQKASFRVEAKGDIGGFNRELVGAKLEITGTVKERKLTKEYIDQMEKNVELKKKEDGSAESCQAEISNINEMRQWMKEQNKEYYAIYYMDGQSYEVLNEK